MKIHKNARLTPKGREILVCRIVNEELRVEEAAQASRVSVRTAYNGKIQKTPLCSSSNGGVSPHGAQTYTVDLGWRGR